MDWQTPEDAVPSAFVTESNRRAIAGAPPASGAWRVGDDPGDRRFVPVAILATELYLEGSRCGIDPAYATAVREALHPLANQAFLDAATP
jgi:hypothetical protein